MWLQPCERHVSCVTTPLRGPRQTISVEPKRGQTLTFEFQPQEAGPHTHEARICVRNNPFEDYCIALTGEGYQEDIAFELLPNDSLDELRLPDTAIGASVQAVFVLQNHSNKNFRWGR
jgi:hydrocephalus-inducing protein